jgi:pimeloyl-ACP methyl ester carboxylesterase
LDPAGNEGRLASILRAAAHDCDGNKILQRVARLVAANFLGQGPVSQQVITAMTQLAVTGSRAFAAWSANPIKDLTSVLIQEGMQSDAAATASKAIMADFDAAMAAVRNPAAGVEETSLRSGLRNGKWIAVSGEDDPPDFPVNTSIAPFPQYHIPTTVPTDPRSGGIEVPVNLSIRCIVASTGSATPGPCRSQFQGPAPAQPQIPPGDEIILFLHGEGSRAEEVLDFIPALFAVGAKAGRSFTVIAFDQPSTAYSTMIPHETVAGPLERPAFPDLYPSGDFPLLDFVYNSIVAFVESFIVPFGNPITAVVGGSLGGHMALRLAASEKQWLNNVIAWSPACVMDHTAPVGPSTIPQSLVSDQQIADSANDSESDASRAEFFSKVWDQPTFDPTWINLGIELALGPAGFLLATLPPVPAQPLLWYRDDWPTGAPMVPLAPWGPAVSVGPTKAVYIQEARRDRREIYNQVSRRWHWRICGEMIRYSFEGYAPKKPLLLMVGEDDNYPLVHFADNVKSLAGTLKGLGKCLVVQDTGHSIHNERPFFLANQVVAFAPRP